MKITDLEKLCKEYILLSKGSVDFKKYSYYAATHHSTVIEGSSLTESQVINLLEYGKTATGKPYDHHQMVYDHYKALLFVVENAINKQKLSIQLLKEIVSHVMKNTGGYVKTIIGTYDISKGDFRLGSVRAGTRTFPDYKKVPEMVTKLLKEINENLSKCKTFKSKCELAFKAHFDLVSIHPFGDGNGRTSRLLMNYIQAYYDLPLSVVFKQNRIQYINALELTRKKEDMKYYFDFMFSQYEKLLKKQVKELKGK